MPETATYQDKARYYLSTLLVMSKEMRGYVQRAHNEATHGSMYKTDTRKDLERFDAVIKEAEQGLRNDL